MYIKNSFNLKLEFYKRNLSFHEFSQLAATATETHEVQLNSCMEAPITTSSIQCTISTEVWLNSTHYDFPQKQLSTSDIPAVQHQNKNLKARQSFEYFGINAKTNARIQIVIVGSILVVQAYIYKRCRGIVVSAHKEYSLVVQYLVELPAPTLESYILLVGKVLAKQPSEV